MPSQKEVNKFLTKFRGGTIQKEIDALIKKFGLSNAKAKDMAIRYNASGGPDPRLSPWGPADMPESTDRPTYAKLKWNSSAERDKAYTKMLRHYPNNPAGFQGFTYRKVGAFWITMNITTMVTNPVNRLKDYKLGDYKVVSMKEEAPTLDKFMEDAPANATGTAVAGTGDDSSTVVVKKKDKMKDKLLRRFKIKETIDRTIPDLEKPKDEIKEKVKHLKAMAVKDMPTMKGSPLKTVKKVHNKVKARHSIMGMPSTKYKGLAFTHKVPNYTKA